MHNTQKRLIENIYYVNHKNSHIQNYHKGQNKNIHHCGIIVKGPRPDLKGKPPFTHYSGFTLGTPVFTHYTSAGGCIPQGLVKI